MEKTQTQSRKRQRPVKKAPRLRLRLLLKQRVFNYYEYLPSATVLNSSQWPLRNSLLGVPVKHTMR